MLYYRNGANVRLPGSFDIPAFPSYLQTKLDNKEPCQKNPKDRHIMIRVLYEAVAQYTMYVSVLKAMLDMESDTMICKTWMSVMYQPKLVKTS